MLLVIDVQERLAPAMEPELFRRATANLVRLGQAARLLGVPALISEQYPKGLGPTIPEVKSAFEGAPIFEKAVFDAAREPVIQEAIRGLQRPTVLVAGIEAHICVYQTVRSLAKTHAVHVLCDGVASRTRENMEVGLELAVAAGAVLSSTETVLFDLLERAGTDAFKAISKLLR